MKVVIRREARRRRLPVVMATAEGGMLDVERFDLEPDPPLFHGLAPALDSTDLSTVSHEDRVHFALQVIGVDQVSDRSAASMIEIDRTVSTWPQLAGEVVSGGAHAAMAVRRILLGQPCPSGRYHLDLDRIVESGGRPATSGGVTPLRPARDRRRTRSRMMHPDGFVEEVIAAATSAPSAGNSQPWRFAWDGRRLFVRLDRQRARSAIDPRCAAGWIALGAACENIAIMSGHRGRPARFKWFPDSADHELAATVTFAPKRGASQPDCTRLFPLIIERCTDRTIGAACPLSNSQRQALVRAAAVHGASLQLIQDPSRLERFAAVIGASDRLRFLNPTLHRELASELRWSEDRDPQSATGIDVGSLGLEPAGLASLRLLMRPAVSDFLAEHDLGSRLAEIQRRTLMATTALAMVTMPARTPLQRVRGGRALQRVWLEATAHRLSVHPVTPLSLFDMLNDDQSCLSEADRRAVRHIAREIAGLFAVGDATPILIMRLHHGSAVIPVRAPRRPLHEVLHTVRAAA
jgi:nitroreductase